MSETHSLQSRFSLPENSVYLAGNSLGPMPHTVAKEVAKELSVWAQAGVTGHTSHPETPWVTIDDDVREPIAAMVGAKPSEVVSMGTLTSNLHLMLDAFYKPTAYRYKIIYEEKAFPSDVYAFESQAAKHGFNPKSALVPVRPRKGEHTLRTEDILSVIDDYSYQLALVCIGGVQYYTGQLFDMRAISQAGHEAGAAVGFDVAHAIGNVPLSLHDWNVDFAVWCSYKYLNSGPGGIAGLFVHEVNFGVQRLAGWFGHELSSRFAMPPSFKPEYGAAGFRLSNPSVLCVAALRGALAPFREAYEAWKQFPDENHFLLPVRRRSLELTGYLESLLKSSPHYAEEPGDAPSFQIITPADPEQRGAQLSLLFAPAEAMPPIFAYLGDNGIVADEREPAVIRLTPAPLYNTTGDCDVAVRVLNEAFSKLRSAD